MCRWGQKFCDKSCEKLKEKSDGRKRGQSEFYIDTDGARKTARRNDCLCLYGIPLSAPMIEAPIKRFILVEKMESNKGQTRTRSVHQFGCRAIGVRL